MDLALLSLSWDLKSTLNLTVKFLLLKTMAWLNKAAKAVFLIILGKSLFPARHKVFSCFLTYLVLP